MSSNCSGARAPVTTALFPLGRILATPGVLKVLTKNGVSPDELLRRHSQGDWGRLDDEDVRSNNQALRNGCRLLSNYPLDGDERVWIITEADRSVTTLLLPEDY